MKICVAQIKPVKGDIKANIERHKKFIDIAVANGAGMIVFPELSLTGYEPELAKALATDSNDKRLEDFQLIANTKQIVIGIGVPTQTKTLPNISMILFRPNEPGEIYSKKYLHSDEEPFFVSGANAANLVIDNTNIAPVICYELSVPVHSENAHRNGANVYIASVAKTVTGMEKAAETLSGIAKKYEMTVLISNCVGPCDNFESAGKSAIWNNKGQLLAQLDDNSEGILMIDTSTQEVISNIV